MDEEKLARAATAGDEALLLTSKFTNRRIHTELFRVPTYTHVNAGSTWTSMEIEFVSSLALTLPELA